MAKSYAQLTDAEKAKRKAYQAKRRDKIMAAAKKGGYVPQKRGPILTEAERKAKRKTYRKAYQAKIKAGYRAAKAQGLI